MHHKPGRTAWIGARERGGVVKENVIDVIDRSAMISDFQCAT